MNPKIGIIVCGSADNCQFVTTPYIDAVTRFGGVPLVLPIVNGDRIMKQYVELCDGFLFCGGGDITPLLFFEEPQFGNGTTDLQLDYYQIHLMQHILKRRMKPVLGICRGMQVLNVACGGSVYQDISLQPGSPFNHMQSSLSRSDISHQINTTHGSQLFEILGHSVYTNSYHHQTLNKIGQDLVISATASDGTVEAIEMPSHPFVIGVQWHPECMLAVSEPMQQLFHIFIQTGTVYPTGPAAHP